MGYIQDIRKYVEHEPILTAGVGVFVFNDEDKVLMQLRTDYNSWGFPGGAMELGESFEDVARRELREETNLEIDELTLLKILSGKDTYREYPNGDKLYDITAIYVITKYHGDLEVNDDESKKLDWFDINNLPNNMTEYTKNYLEKFGDILNKALDEYKKLVGGIINEPIYCARHSQTILNAEHREQGRNRELLNEVGIEQAKELKKIKIITLCGSLKFQKEMMSVAEKMALEGNCILTPVYPVIENCERTEEQLTKLKEAHFKRIELSDAILVINKGNYIGNSTNLEIEYAKKLEKEIIYYTDLIKEN